MKKGLSVLFLFSSPLFSFAADTAVTSLSLFTNVLFWVVMIVMIAGAITVFNIIYPLTILKELNALQKKDQLAFENLHNNRSIRLASNYTWATLGSLVMIGGVSWSFYQSTLPQKGNPVAEEASVIESTQITVNESNVTLLDDESALSIGKNIYNSNCAACHGQAGEGLVGPNLTDNAWIHGGDIKAIFKTISNGVPEKGMVAWSKTLKPDAIQKVASYILSLQGTNPPNAKAPEGQQIGMKD